MKSLAEISKKYSITKAGLYRRINKIHGFRQKYMHRDKHKANGQWLIDDKAVHLIAKPRYSARPKHYHHAPNHPPTKLDYQRKYEQLLKQNEKQAETILNLSKSFQDLARDVKHDRREQRLIDEKRLKQPSLLGYIKKLFK